MADRRVLVALVAAVLAVGATAGSALIHPQRPAPATSTAVGGAEVLACPALAGSARLVATAPTASVRLRDADKSTVLPVPVSRAAPTDPFALLPVGSQPAGAVTVVAGAAVSWATCDPPLANQTLLLEDSARTDVLLVNTDATDAVVNVTVRGPQGVVDAAGTRGLLVPANASLVVPLSVLSPAGEPVAAEVETTIGRVRAFGRLAGTAGIDVASSGIAGTEHLLGAVPAGAKGLSLLLDNPGQTRATITVAALASSGTFTPAGADKVTVAPGAVTRVDLSAAVSATEALALRVTSDVPIAASLHVTGESDVANLASRPVFANSQVLVSGGRLVLANPTTSDTEVTFKATPVEGSGIPATRQTVKAGATWSVALPARGVRVTVASAVGVGAWVVLPVGTAVAPFQTADQATESVAIDRDPFLR